MSNRDGKHDKRPFKPGQRCHCKKGKLERVYPANHPTKHWRNYVECKSCGFTNF